MSIKLQNMNYILKILCTKNKAFGTLMKIKVITHLKNVFWYNVKINTENIFYTYLRSRD